jgi:hypothetical protein
MVEPRGDQAGAAKVAPVFVRDDVVRVVVARALITEGAYRASREPLRRDHSDELPALGGLGEQGVEGGLIKRSRDAAVVRGHEARLELEDGRTKIDNRVAGGPPAGGVIEPGGDRGRGGGALGLLWEVGLEHELAGALDADAKAGVRAVGFSLVDEPGAVGRARVEARSVAGSTDELLDRHAAAANSVDEPARIGDLVDAVDVDGLGRRVDGKEAGEGAEEGVVGHVPGKGRLVLLRHAELVADFFFVFLGLGVGAASDVDRLRVVVDPERVAEREAGDVAAVAARDERERGRGGEKEGRGCARRARALAVDLG